MLERFYTDIYFGNKPRTLRMLASIAQLLQNRQIERLLVRRDATIAATKVRSFDGFGLLYAAQRALARRGANLDALFAGANCAFNKLITDDGLPPCNAVWSWASASAELFQAAHSHGIACVLDQNHAPDVIMEELIRHEIALWPDWQPSLRPSIHNRLSERQKVEWSLATRIVAPSAFVLDGLRTLGVPREKCKVIPYPIDLTRFAPPAKQEPFSGRRLRVLFVGRISLAKGAQYLLNALAKIGKRHIEARFVGAMAITPQRLAPFRGLVDFEGLLPTQRLPKLYHWADVLVFPTICDAFGLAQAEALASGVPVIATENSGSVVRDRIDGRIVPIRSVEALSSALEDYLQQPDLLESHTRAAIVGRGRFGFDRYAEAVVETLTEACRPTA